MADERNMPEVQDIWKVFWKHSAAGKQNKTSKFLGDRRQLAACLHIRD